MRRRADSGGRTAAASAGTDERQSNRDRQRSNIHTRVDPNAARNRRPSVADDYNEAPRYFQPTRWPGDGRDPGSGPSRRLRPQQRDGPYVVAGWVHAAADYVDDALFDAMHGMGWGTQRTKESRGKSQMRSDEYSNCSITNADLVRGICGVVRLRRDSLRLSICSHWLADKSLPSGSSPEG